MPKPSNRIPDRLSQLPHWARVAFAARCVQAVWPLYLEFWPDAKARRRRAVETAVELAGRSAALAQPIDGLEQAWVEATKSARVALTPIHGFVASEPTPDGQEAAMITFQVAKSAEWAARTAAASPRESTEAARGAYGFARDAAEEAGAPDIEARLRREFEALQRVSSKGQWTDSTPVPPAVFDLLVSEDAEHSR